MADGILSRLRKGVKRTKAKAKAKRNKRQRKRARRRKGLRKKKEVVGEVGGDIGEILGSTRTAGAARATGRAAKKAASATETGLQKLEEGVDRVESSTLSGRLEEGNLSVGELKNELEFVNNPGRLNQLLRAERRGENRSTAKKAIRSRKEEIEAGGGGGIMGFGVPNDFSAEGMDFEGDDEPFLTGGQGDQPFLGDGLEMVDDPMFGEPDDDDGDRERDSFGLDF